MKSFRVLPVFLLLLLGLSLSACGATPETLPAPASPIVVPSRPAETDIPTPLAPDTDFESVIYLDPILGIELDYPKGWFVEVAHVGGRAGQAQISSWQHAPGDAVTDRPAGTTLVNVTVFQWEPQNDLAAFVSQRRLAWESSGFPVLSEEAVTLKDGWPAVTLLVQFPEGQVFYLITYVGASYVEVSGDGDLDLVRRIAFTLRPMGRQ